MLNDIKVYLNPLYILIWFYKNKVLVKLFLKFTFFILKKFAATIRRCTLNETRLVTLADKGPQGDKSI